MVQERRIQRRRGPLGDLIQANVMGHAGHLIIRGGRQLLAPQKPRPKVKPRTSTKKTTKKTTRTSSRVKVGTYAGRIIASKPVGIPKVGARIRNRTFGNQITQNQSWLFGNSMGNEKYFCSLAAESIITHMLREIKDFRSDKGSKVSGSVYRYEVQFSPSDSVLLSGAPKVMVMTLGADTSFNGMVYNPLGAIGNSMTIDGVNVGSVPERNLVAQLFLRAIEGYYPSGLAVNRDSFVTDSYVYRDTQFGKAMLSMRIGTDFKFQNVTPAGDGTTETDNNVNAIDANPLMGKIATFRNMSPKWNKGWIAQQDPGDQNTLTNFSGRPFSLATFDYKQVSTSPFSIVAEEQRAMPLKMGTVFSNAQTCTTVHFPPGGYKTFKTSFSYKGSITKFMRDTTQVSSTSQDIGKYPPLGNSFGMCLVPTIKTDLHESIKMIFDYSRDGSAHIVKYRGGSLPTTNQIL